MLLDELINRLQKIRVKIGNKDIDIEIEDDLDNVDCHDIADIIVYESAKMATIVNKSRPNNP